MTHQQMAALEGFDSIDKVTLYRTLATLRAAGLVHVVRGADGSALYCANSDGDGCPGGHPHFQCLDCKEMHCVLEQRLPHLAFNEPVVVKAKQFVAFGLCAACAKKEASKLARKRAKRREVVR
jgi:Fur family ferric uptake transcriptional regulator/Fur family zinc uptake transcriptional regulator